MTRAFVWRWKLALLAAGLLGLSAQAAWSQNPPSLVAPVYPGATSDCPSMDGKEEYTRNYSRFAQGSCFTTRDRLDKVRRFYEGKGASFNEMEPGTQFAAILDVVSVTSGLEVESDTYRGVWIIKTATGTVINISQKDSVNHRSPRTPNAKDRECLLLQFRDPNYGSRDTHPASCEDASRRQGAQPAPGGQPAQPEKKDSGTDDAVKAGKSAFDFVKKLF